jgi:hypothetical protein
MRQAALLYRVSSAMMLYFATGPKAIEPANHGFFSPLFKYLSQMFPHSSRKVTNIYSSSLISFSGIF